jgi:lysophospholipid acyltransferase (LPLAT)-like uncharacterized protein
LIGKASWDWAGRGIWQEFTLVAAQSRQEAGMKIRNPRLISMAAWAGSWALRSWVATLRFDYRPLGKDFNPKTVQGPQRYIYAFWHEALLVPARIYGHPSVRILISGHADGQLIAEMTERLGYQSVRGSSTRGGSEAMREMFKLSSSSHFVVTPDGPRGPRRKVQKGVIYLAARTGLPIIPIGFGFDDPWRAKSWDQFILPRPFRRGVAITTDTIHVPQEADHGTLEQYRLQLQAHLDELTEMAESMVARPRQTRKAA